MFSLFKGILDGTVRISDRKKYRLVVVAFACVHIMLVFTFIAIRSLPMAIYNVFSAAGYFYCLKRIKRRALFSVYLNIYIEVMLHSLLSVYAVGWECGFAMYLIAIIPIGFDLAFALNDKAKGISIAVAFGVLSFAVFILCKRFSYICSPVYTIESDFFRELIYIFNTLCTFALLISYSFVFASEILHAQKSLEENNRKLDALASTDTLTGLYNRRRMHVFLKAAAEEKRTFSVIMSDIDDFKHINDTYGHDCGDEALKTVSAIVKECLPQDDNVCRWGGEEFLMISSRTLSEAADIAEKIRAAVESRQISYEGKDIRITLTLGVAEYTPGISTIDSVITAADKKLYEGKNSGKNCVIS